MNNINILGVDFVRAYRVDELEGEALEYAKRWALEHLFDLGDALHQVREEFAFVLHDEGIQYDEIYLGLDHCQGDGVSFDSDPQDLSEFIKSQGWEYLLADGFEPIGRFIKTSHRHEHPYTMDFEWWDVPIYLSEDEEYRLARLGGLIIDYARAVCVGFVRTGYDILDSLQSDERAYELLEAYSDSIRFVINLASPSNITVIRL